jgi:hypothetical protein
MINFDNILNQLEFEELLDIIHEKSGYTKTELDDMNNKNKSYYWEIVIKTIQQNYNNIIDDLKTKLKIHEKTEVDRLLGEFLYNNYRDLDIAFIHDHTCYVATIMIKYIYDKYSFNDLNLFLDSMLFKSYDDVVLNMVLPVIRANNPDKLPIFWNNCACSQKLSVSFINMHYMKFNTPDLAYNLSVHNSEFWKCNQMIISKIKKLSLQKN